MSASEEYLDGLLNAVTKQQNMDEVTSDPAEDASEEIIMEQAGDDGSEDAMDGALDEEELNQTESDSDISFSPDDIMAMFGQEEEFEQEENAGREKVGAEDTDGVEEDMLDDTVSLFGDGMEDEDNDEVLDMAPALGDFEDDMSVDSVVGEEQQQGRFDDEADSMISEDMDLSDILNNLGGEDSELGEIGELLEKSDNHEIVDEEVLTALNPDAVDPSAEIEAVRLSDIESDGKSNQKKKEKKKRGLFSFLRKKENIEEAELTKDETPSSAAEDENKQNEELGAALDVMSDIGSILGMSSDAGEGTSDGGGEEGLDPDSMQRFLNDESPEGYPENLPEKKSENASDDGETTEQKDEKGEEKKKGVFGKFIDFLMEEDEDEENEEVSEEADGKGDSVKGKTKKAKKGKKGKKGGVSDADDNNAILEEMDAEEGDKKEKKAKKPKKVKEQKEESEPVVPGKRLPVKMVLRIFILCFSIMALLLIVVNILPEITSLSDARNAFYRQQYDAAYQEMAGKNLSASDDRIYQKARIIVKLQRKIDAYEYFRTMNMPVEAFDALLSGYTLCGTMSADIIEYDAVNETDAVKSQILQLLQEVYGLTEEDAVVIISMDDYNYTARLEEITGALSSKNSNYGKQDASDAESADGQVENQEQSEKAETEPVLPTEDVLPEEEIE